MLDHGFELVRSNRHNIVKRGAMKFTLSTSGGCGPWLTQALLNVCDEIDHKLEKQGKRARHSLPAMVRYDGEDFACIDQGPMQWKIQSLETGRSRWVKKSESEPLTTMPELIKHEPETIVQQAAEAVLADAKELEAQATALLKANGHNPLPPLNIVDDREPEPEPAPHNVYTPFVAPKPAPEEGFGPLGVAVTSTRRAIERLAVEIEQHEAIIAPKRVQLQAFQQALAIMEGGIAALPETIKRTILPPSDAPKARKVGHSGNGKKPAATEAQMNTARARWMNGDRVIEIANSLGVSDASVYGWAQRWKAAGYKRRV